MTAKLDFIIGRSGTGKTEYCLRAMQAAMQREPLGPALILLLPEHMTYKVERQLASQMAAGHGFFRAYVFGFRRFARQILMETGDADTPRISDVGRQLLLRRILVQHQKAKDLTVFARSAHQRGFTQNLSDAIKEIKSYELTPETLRTVAENLGENSSRLAGKMQELSQLAEDFQAEMAGKANDAEDMMQLLAEKLPSASLMQGAEVWLDGFIFFNPQEMSVLASLLQSADKVHITLPMTGQRLANGTVNLRVLENVQEAGMFNRSYRTMENVCRLMHDIEAVPYTSFWYPTTLLETRQRAVDVPELQVVERQLFGSYNLAAELSPPAPPRGDKGGNATSPAERKENKVRLVEAANRRLEVEAVAADILRLVREKAYRYRDIGVLVRDGDAYDAVLRLVLQDYDIPFFQDGKRPSTHHPLAELLRSSLDVVTKGWRYETVFRALRTGFFPLVREDVDKLENYVLEFGIRGPKRWLQDTNWSWHRRYSLDEDGEEVADDTVEKLQLIDGLRRQAAAPLAAFAQELQGAKDVQAYTTALYHLLVALAVPVHLEEWQQIAEKEGRLADAAEHKQIWQDIMNLFDQLVEISGDEAMSLTDFAAILNDGLDALQISLIPPGLDYVTIASFDQNSLENSRAIYILGANAGMMPRRTTDQGLFTDADRLHIEEALKGLAKEGEVAKQIFRGSRERSFGEKFLMYRAFNESNAYLWVSYALADSEGEGLQPAPLVARLQAIVPELDFLSIPLETIDRTDSLRLSSARPALSGLANALRGEKEKGKMDGFWQDVYNWARQQPELKRPLRLALAGLFAKADDGELPEELAHTIYTKGKSLRGSVTQFEKFRQCPFAHFAQYGLQLQERREYRFRSMDYGQLIHAVLKEYGERVKADYHGHWQDVPSGEQQTICHELVETLAPKLQSEVLFSRADYQHLKQRIEHTALRSIRHLSAWAGLSKFQPTYFEEAFGHAGDDVTLTPLPLGGGYSLSFKGQIDRLDLQQEGDYFLVVDYKTGNVGINVFQVYYGLRLQLLVYVLVAEQLMRQQGEDRLPAGMLYALVQDPLIRTGKKLSDDALQAKVNAQLKMPGWVLADPDIIASIDASLKFIKPSLNKDGSISKSSQSYVKTPEEFQTLLSYVDYILRDTGREILQGNIKVEPYRVKNKKEDNACRYCIYRDVCGFDVEIPGYAYRDIEPLKDEVWETQMEKELEEKDGDKDNGNEVH